MPPRRRKSTAKAPSKPPAVQFAQKLEQPTPKRMKRLSENDLIDVVLDVAGECKTRAQLTTALAGHPTLKKQIEEDMVTGVMHEVFGDDAVEMAVAKLRIRSTVLENLRFHKKQIKQGKVSKKFDPDGQDGEHLASTFGAMAVALACNKKSAAKVDVSPLVSGPDDAECYDKTSVFRLSEDSNVRNCHASRCAYNSGGSWFASVAGNACLSCEKFLEQAHAQGRADALMQFFWFTALAASAQTPNDVCVHGDQMLDLALLLLDARGDGKAVAFGLGFDHKQYFKTLTNPALAKSITEKAGDLATFKNTAILVGAAALIGGGAYLVATYGTAGAAEIVQGWAGAAQTQAGLALTTAQTKAKIALAEAQRLSGVAMTAVTDTAGDMIDMLKMNIKFLMTGKVMESGMSMAERQTKANKRTSTVVDPYGRPIQPEPPKTSMTELKKRKAAKAEVERREGQRRSENLIGSKADATRRGKR